MFANGDENLSLQDNILVLDHTDGENSLQQEKYNSLSFDAEVFRTRFIMNQLPKLRFSVGVKAYICSVASGIGIAPSLVLHNRSFTFYKNEEIDRQYDLTALEWGFALVVKRDDIVLSLGLLAIHMNVWQKEIQNRYDIPYWQYALELGFSYTDRKSSDLISDLWHFGFDGRLSFDRTFDLRLYASANKKITQWQSYDSGIWRLMSSTSFDLTMLEGENVSDFFINYDALGSKMYTNIENADPYRVNFVLTQRFLLSFPHFVKKSANPFLSFYIENAFGFLGEVNTETHDSVFRFGTGIEMGLLLFEKNILFLRFMFLYPKQVHNGVSFYVVYGID